MNFEFRSSEESINDLFFNKLLNTYNLCKNIHDSILNSENKNILQSSNTELDQVYSEIEQLKSQQELEIKEIQDRYECQIDLICKERLEPEDQEKLIEVKY